MTVEISLYFGPRQLNQEMLNLCSQKVSELLALAMEWRSSHCSLKERVAITSAMFELVPETRDWVVPDVTAFVSTQNLGRMVSEANDFWTGEKEGLSIHPLRDFGDEDFRVAVVSYDHTPEAWLSLRWLEKMGFLKDVGVVRLVELVKKKKASEG